MFAPNVNQCIHDLLVSSVTSGFQTLRTYTFRTQAFRTTGISKTDLNPDPNPNPRL